MKLSSYVRSVTDLPTTDQLTALAESVVADGFDAHRAAVADLVTAARRCGVRPVLAEAVADASAPRPVRDRALGLLVVALSACHDDQSAPVATGAASAA